VAESRVHKVPCYQRIFYFILPFTTQRCRSATEKNIFEDLFSSVLSQFKKYHPSRNLKFYDLGILESLKMPILLKKFLPISLKLHFTPNTLGCKGLIIGVESAFACSHGEPLRIPR